jgi:hypothetical protein
MTTLREMMETRYPAKDWTHLDEDSCFIDSKGIYRIKTVCWYDDLPIWTSDEIKTFLGVT